MKAARIKATGVGRMLRTCLLLAACTPVGAATLLEYERQGDCATEFERMLIDGARARIDMRVDGTELSTLFDDGEQIMHQLMHDTRTYLTMESDDDAVDFTSDVVKSSTIHAQRQAEAVSGLDAGQAMAAFRSAQVAACPEMAALGLGDPDYADAAARCAGKMAEDARPVGDRKAAIAARTQRARVAAPSPPTDGATALQSTVRIERTAMPQQVDGRACAPERTLRGQTPLREDCRADVTTLGLDARAVRRLQRIAKVGAGMGEGLASLHPELDTREAGPPKVTLRRVCYRGGQESGKATLHIRNDAPADAALFELPPGYEPMQIAAPALTTPAQAMEALQRSGTQRPR
jgi:hypothetical protein